MRTEISVPLPKTWFEAENLFNLAVTSTITFQTSGPDRMPRKRMDVSNLIENEDTFLATSCVESVDKTH